MPDTEDRPGSPPDDARRIFDGIGATYERAGALMSFGQDPRWRARLVSLLDAHGDDVVLDVATGTGLVAREIGARYGCAVIAVDRSDDMLRAASLRDGHLSLVRARAERLPFADGSFDHATFTYLLRYVDEPAAVLREVARVVRPGGRIVALDFGVPPHPLLRLLWRAYTSVGLPLIGRAISSRWASVGAFLRGSIERYARDHVDVATVWRDAGLADVEVTRMSFGAAVLISARKGDGAPADPAFAPSAAAPAFYALRGGGWRDYWTLLHPPYTAWHLSYVLLGAAIAPLPDPRIVAGALLAFFLGVGVASHSFDELQGRPLRTGIPSLVLVLLGVAGLVGAVALGVAAAMQLGAGFLAIVAIGAALVIAYGLELPLVHSDLGFALAWGGFPVVATASACGAPALPTIAVAVGASLLSLAQRRLSTPVRRVRRAATDVSGTVRYRDGAVETIDAARLIAAPEAALRILWLASVAIAVGALLARWTGG